MNFVKAVFISDVHLTSLKEKSGVLFLEFLRSLHGVLEKQKAESHPQLANCPSTQELTHLFFLGDIFDLWIAHHSYFVNKYQEVIDEVVRLKKEGVEIHYFEGNHDLYLKRFWAEELDVVVHEEGSVFQLGSWRVRAEHGDLSDPEDRGYLFLRWFLRTSFMRYLAHHLPEKAVVFIGDRASRNSRRYTSQVKTISAQNSLQKMKLHAEKQLLVPNQNLKNSQSTPNFDILVMGHLHEKADFRVQVETNKSTQSARVINLGVWGDSPMVLVLDREQVSFYELGNQKA